MEGAHRRDQADRPARAPRPPAGPRGPRATVCTRPHATGAPVSASSRVAWTSASKKAGQLRRTLAAPPGAGPATVSSSPRAIGPVRARSAPTAAQFSTVARTSGTSSDRSPPARAISCSAAPSTVTRKFEATEAAAWYSARSDFGDLHRAHVQRAGPARSPAPALARSCRRPRRRRRRTGRRPGSPSSAGEARRPHAGPPRPAWRPRSNGRPGGRDAMAAAAEADLARPARTAARHRSRLRRLRGRVARSPPGPARAKPSASAWPRRPWPMMARLVQAGVSEGDSRSSSRIGDTGRRRLRIRSERSAPESVAASSLTGYPARCAMEHLGAA